MELNNGVNVLLLLALSSLILSFSANAICVPRNSSEFQSPAASHVPPIAAPVAAPVVAPVASVVPTVSPPQSPPPPTVPAPAPAPPASDDPSLESGNHKHTPPVISPTVKTDLVEICDVTSNPKLCTNSISSHIQGSTVDPITALKTEIGESIKEVEKAIDTLNELSKDSSQSHVAIECFDTCLENFDSAIDDLKAGLESIDSHDAARMESVLTAVLTDLMTCDDTFAEMGVDSPLDSLTTKMNKYASNCLALSKLLL